MTHVEIPDNHHVVRYISPGRMMGEKAGYDAFFLRPGDTGLSVNWMEWRGGTDKCLQLSKIREFSRLEIKPKGRYAEMIVGNIRKSLKDVTGYADVVHSPLEENGGPADPSHSEILGIPPGTDDSARAAAEELADCVERLHPAIVS